MRYVVIDILILLVCFGLFFLVVEVKCCLAQLLLTGCPVRCVLLFKLGLDCSLVVQALAIRLKIEFQIQKFLL